MNKQAFDVLLHIWSSEIVTVDEKTEAPMIGVELLHPEWWEVFDHKRDRCEDLSAAIIRTGSLKVFKEIAASQAKLRTLH